MNKNEFSLVRKTLNKTQKQISELLGVSIKTIHSYEQGWRNVPKHVERQLYFFLTKQIGHHRVDKPCWEIKNCENKEQCPAFEFQSGDMCWFICGTRCNGTVDNNCNEKLKTCRECEVLNDLLMASGIVDEKN